MKTKTEDFCTNPRDPKFFEGTTLEKKLSVLRHLSPTRYAGAEMLVLEVLREEFLKLAPDPRAAGRGVQ